VADFIGKPGFSAASTFLEKSEQRNGRFFCHHDEDFFYNSAT
jgi:hypothetical protein